jgi:alanyl-tRNA synthetase
MNADILREKFLNFFKAKKHKIIESDSLVPSDDPTVLFTPAGMNQFKKQFLGYITDFRRAASSQRCLRTDDLDKVGKTSGHHTFFEMLGNFSFGDYFKPEAISWAWEFLTKELKIKKEKLWVSIYQDDDEAFKIWKDLIKVPEKKIIKLTDKENFWPSQAKEKGPNGPCGECSEIFFDYGKDVGCGRQDCNPACGCSRFVELWNLVFTQFNRKDGGILEPLPQKNIDTGMGLERLTAVMEGKKSNFETELFVPLIKEIIPKAKCSPRLPDVYAISDHIRAIVFSIFDGVLPSNEARGYVIRKLIRKSILHLKALGIEKPFLYKLVPILSQIMNVPYPELKNRQENIAEIILSEEKNFLSILESSDILLKEKFQEVIDKPDPIKTGKIAFMLYDTYGIPLELVSDWLNKHKIEISQQTFNQELKQQKIRSQLQSSMKGDVFSSKDLKFAAKETKFLGYHQMQIKAKILQILRDGVEVKKINKDEPAEILLDKSVFYAESGGQVGDTGELLKGKNCFEVIDTKKVQKIVVHIGKVKYGVFKKGDFVLAKIDAQRRLDIARNHTATHLLQAALRKVLGVHVKQQGSLVQPVRLRFDFTHFRDLNKEQLERIEEEVYHYVIENHPIETKFVSLSQAKKEGALAFFGEKYESRVRMVEVVGISKELCGGTHLNSTGQVGLFKIIHEGSISRGIRRIEAVTGKSAYRLVKEQENIIADVAVALNTPQDKIASELEKRLMRAKELERELGAKRLDSAKNLVDKLIESAQDIKGVKVVFEVLEDADMDFLRKTVDLVKEKSQNTIVVLGSSRHQKALLVMGITPDLCEKGLDAASLIMETAKIIGGSGGGRKDFAQAGGNQPENFTQAFGGLRNIIEKLL